MQSYISTSTAQCGSATSSNSTATDMSSPLLSQYLSKPIFPPGYSTSPYSTPTTPQSQISHQYSPNSSSPPYSNHQHYQDTINRHSLCLTHLRKVAQEVVSLRNENETLRSVNRELNQHLNHVVQESVQNHFSGSTTPPFDIVSSFQGMRIEGGKGNGSGSSGAGAEGRMWEEESDESPTSVIEPKVDLERVSLPKSISVRSSGYLKVVSQANSNRTRSITRPKTAVPADAAQKVYVKGGKKEEEPLELQVYNQGMFKTELCNKWQETGACPYGEHCQFAHGIEELRPVIRHPRYKTEVCRMVLAGVLCPYGHRCHFRHALSEEERMMGQLKSA